ncbi:CapA family protein [Patescibacteria group bacterium]|nr:CapA family protein [Patescibacteria group bacterium]
MATKKKLLLFSLVFIPLLLLAFKLLSPRPVMSPSHFSSPSSNPKRITVLKAVGDVMLGRMVNVKMLENKDFRYPFLKTAELLSSADITFGNLESPIINECKTTQTGMVFCGRKESVEGLSFAGFDVVSIANNHILNHGQEGRGQTIEFLNQKNILPSANELTIQQTNNLNFGFLSFDLTVNNNPEPIIKKVSESSSRVDILIVSLHWGAEYIKEPFPWQKELAHSLIDQGAKVVLGHHPHVTQPTEEYSNGLIFYSLGNFVFDQMWSEETRQGQIAEIVFEEKEIKSYKLIPVYIKDYCQPGLAD